MYTLTSMQGITGLTSNNLDDAPKNHCGETGAPMLNPQPRHPPLRHASERMT